MRRLALLAVALLLAGCAQPQREMTYSDAVMAEPAVAAASACPPGDDDGIGGTGCQPD